MNCKTCALLSPLNILQSHWRKRKWFLHLQTELNKMVLSYNLYFSIEHTTLEEYVTWCYVKDYCFRNHSLMLIDPKSFLINP